MSNMRPARLIEHGEQRGEARDIAFDLSAPDASASGAVSLPRTIWSSVLRAMVTEAAAWSDHSPRR